MIEKRSCAGKHKWVIYLSIHGQQFGIGKHINKNPVCLTSFLNAASKGIRCIIGISDVICLNQHVFDLRKNKMSTIPITGYLHEIKIKITNEIWKLLKTVAKKLKMNMNMNW